MNERKELPIPDVIYLQWYGDGDPQDGGPCEIGDEVTWCSDGIFEHDIKYVRASLSLLEGREQPQPIETARRDEVSRLLFDPSHGWVSGYWNTVWNRWETETKAKINPTHWQNFPAAPTKGQEGDERED